MYNSKILSVSVYGTIYASYCLSQFTELYMRHIVCLSLRNYICVIMSVSVYETMYASYCLSQFTELYMRHIVCLSLRNYICVILSVSVYGIIYASYCLSQFTELYMRHIVCLSLRNYICVIFVAFFSELTKKYLKLTTNKSRDVSLILIWLKSENNTNFMFIKILIWV